MEEFVQSLKKIEDKLLTVMVMSSTAAKMGPNLAPFAKQLFKYIKDHHEAWFEELRTIANDSRYTEYRTLKGIKESKDTDLGKEADRLATEAKDRFFKEKS